MITDSYKIFVSLSHRRIAIEYWQRDGEDKLMPMPNNTWPAPLAFYCSDSGMIIGEDAARAAHNGTENAFDNYFEILSEDRTYSIGGQTRPIRNLLLDACERVFRNFYKDVLLNRFGTLNDNRANMPLTIICDSDIKPNERAFLRGLFKDCGYNHVSVIEYEKYIGEFIKNEIVKDYTCDYVVVAWTEGIDLTFSLFSVKGNSTPINQTFPGLGIDPRMEYVKKLIWESIQGQNPWLEFEKEEDSITKAAEDFLSSSTPLVKDTILLSDGENRYYELNRHNIDSQSNIDGVSIKERLNEFLRNNGIYNYNNEVLILRGNAANNSYFEYNLCHGFAKTIKSDLRLRNNTMKYLLANHEPTIEPIVEPVIKTQATTEPAVKPAIKTQATAEPAVEPAIKSQATTEPAVEPAIKSQATTEQSEPDLLKPAQRRWREVRASANGKKNNGFTEVAHKMLSEFYEECKSIAGAESLLKEIQAEIEKIEQVKNRSNSQPKSEPQTKAQPQVKPEAKPQAQPVRKSEPVANTAKIGEYAKKWREIKADANGKARMGRINDAILSLATFKGEMQNTVGADDILKEIQSEIDKILNIKTNSDSRPISKPQKQAQSQVKPEAKPETQPVHKSEPDSNKGKIGEYAKKWREIKADAKGKERVGRINEAVLTLSSFQEEVKKTMGTSGSASTLLKLIEFEIHNILQSNNNSNSQTISKPQTKAQSQVKPKAQPVNKSEPNSNKGKIDEYAKKWRDIKADANEKARAGRINEAVLPLASFKERIKNTVGADGLLNEIQSEIDKILKVKTIRNSQSTSAPKNGKTLMKEGKLQEARKWFIDNGDWKMGSKLYAIISLQKTLEKSTTEIENCRRGKNIVSQLYLKMITKKCIALLDQFVTLCHEAGVDSTEYKKLLREYKKL